jgi:hypothetical protein
LKVLRISFQNQDIVFLCAFQAELHAPSIVLLLLFCGLILELQITAFRNVTVTLGLCDPGNFGARG